MPRHSPIHTVFQSDLLRVVDHRCSGHDDARGEVPQDFEIVLPRSGAYQRRDAHGAFLADPNQVLFFNRGEPYDISHPIQGGDASTIFVVAPSLLLEIAQAHNPAVEDDQRIFPRSHFTLNSRLQVLQYRLLREAETADALEIEEEIIAAVDEILRVHYQTRPEPRNNSASARRDRAEQVLAVKTFLNANVGSNLLLEDISSAVHLSPYHLCRVFKREAGMTIHQYVNRLRLFNAAERMVENPVTRLDALALDFGFANHGHFSVAFRKLFGINPSEFRDPRFRQLSKILEA
jgi:AraC-like DNA-binding protein